MRNKVIIKYILGFFLVVIQCNNAQWTEFGNLDNKDIKSMTYYKDKYISGTTEGIYIYSESNMNWDLVINSPQYIDKLVFNNDYIFAAGRYSNGIYVSADSGNIWELRNNGLSNTRILSLTVKDNWIFAGTDYDYITPNSGVYRTSNNGEIWTYSNNGLSNISMNRDFTVCQNIIFLTSVYYIPPGPSVSGGVYKSTDNGGNWDYISSGLINRNVVCLANVPTSNSDSSEIFVSDKLNPGGQTPSGSYKSTNFGENWLVSNNGIENKAIISFAIYEDKLFALSSDNQLFFTSNFGNNWIIIDTVGLPSSEYKIFNSIFVNNDALYITTNGFGIWKRNISEISSSTRDLPLEYQYSLSQNYPNPFNPITTIEYSVPELSFVILKIFDLLGRETATIVNEVKTVGNYKFKLNAKSLSSGIYFYRLQAGSYSETKKLILLK